MAVKSLNDLFVHTLKDIYYAEKQILKALPKMAEKAANERLADAFTEHREETVGQIERLEQVFEVIGKKAAGEKCDAIEGLIEEAEGLMEEIDDADTLDAALLAAAQAVEHYEIARYGTLIAWARRLGQDEARDLLEENLKQEKNADELLTDIATDEVNAASAAA
ncbi:MAG: YciE/YciF ferroxidase family protein [Inquilinaceae bacterium]